MQKWSFIDIEVLGYRINRLNPLHIAAFGRDIDHHAVEFHSQCDLARQAASAPSTAREVEHVLLILDSAGEFVEIFFADDDVAG